MHLLRQLYRFLSIKLFIHDRHIVSRISIIPSPSSVIIISLSRCFKHTVLSISNYFLMIKIRQNCSECNNIVSIITYFLSSFSLFICKRLFFFSIKLKFESDNPRGKKIVWKMSILNWNQNHKVYRRKLKGKTNSFYYFHLKWLFCCDSVWVLFMKMKSFNLFVHLFFYYTDIHRVVSHLSWVFQKNLKKKITVWKENFCNSLHFISAKSKF